MMRSHGLFLAILGGLIATATELPAQTRPDFSGVWRIIPAASRLVSGPTTVARPGDDYHLTWLVNHRDPEISVVVNLRDSHGSHEYSFTCTTDGRECVNKLDSLQEVRRISAVWKGNVLVMTQHATTPHGDFEARDRLFLEDSGQRLVFDRVVVNALGERSIRQEFRKLGPHPSQRPPQDPLPSIDLPPGIARVLRDYERHWRNGHTDSLVALFTDDGFISRRGWVSGHESLREYLGRTSSDLRLRAVAYGADAAIGYVVGAYGYGDEAATTDRGIFILTLRRGADDRWLIAADLDGTLRP